MKEKIIEILRSKCNGCDLPLALNVKLIAELICKEFDYKVIPEKLSPYNPAHQSYDTFSKCCGIFNIINDDGILCCNECDMTIVELCDKLDDKKGNPLDFATISKLMIKYINDNHHPHCTIIVTNTHAEILEGIKCVKTNDYIKD